jgi:hypothetical protein
VKPDDPGFWPLPLMIDERGRPMRYLVICGRGEYGFSDKQAWIEFTARLREHRYDFESIDRGRQALNPGETP